MIKYIAVVAMFFLAGNVYAGPSCDGASTAAGSGQQTLWKIMFGRSADSDSDCELSTGADNVDVLPVNNAVAVPEKTAWQLEIEDELRDYRDNTELTLAALQKRVMAFKEESVQLNKEVRRADANSTQKLSEIGTALSDTKRVIDKNEARLQLALAGLRQDVAGVSVGLETVEAELGSTVETHRQEANRNISALEEVVRNNLVYSALAILVVLLMLLIIGSVLRKKIVTQQTDSTSRLHDLRTSLEEEFVKVDSKLVEIFEVQMQDAENSPVTQNAEVDHGLVTKIADEVVRIQKNISRMDEKTKGLKQLSASVGRIRDNVASNGYEIVEMLGLPYTEGMRVTADFIPDEDLAPGEQIITRIIKPQINYQGVMIQSAQIEVSQGEE